jgi:hypothetical protein
LGAIEMQLLCPLHLSLSMMIFISPPLPLWASFRENGNPELSNLDSRFRGSDILYLHLLHPVEIHSIL